ncbi:hypothetical protein RHRU231_450118 [Rhodococcus ruber]|uniref:Uncharacterized protein n=1 Tax=Rhodococcus ruber TaxID=1830 RepID=A0A098BMK8_9NOCA|nr:hypothetical protein RHRU231_450118 [Rhodococcus ruber]
MPLVVPITPELPHSRAAERAHDLIVHGLITAMTSVSHSSTSSTRSRLTCASKSSPAGKRCPHTHSYRSNVSTLCHTR